MKTGIAYIISAPSGTGKSSLIDALINTQNESLTNIHIVTSYTTRNIRPGEINGKHYHFISTIQFKNMIQKNIFFEYTKTFNNYYGTSKSSIEPILKIGVDILLNIDWKGAQKVRNKIAKTCSIFIIPPSTEELERRLRNRNQKEKEKTIIQRTKHANNELNHIKEYDYLIVNDNFNIALSNLRRIILAEKIKTIHQKSNKIN
ncbi:guanylate kinase [Blochmannia endosymbiont of Colobopsis nipponica]|uniref:guanylate kinase n=1 Tax=Blochmannia endosymbiont of Colobopsis nipponica TaxID=2681987 RepID=UPI00178757F0|nr:guanylate kinase [Blochmannia endosymbiont of Colobopsis nipponica]QOI10856.1 guanylate kinase [Blochmannia endosymbiont of Colobopsis nipponica]